MHCEFFVALRIDFTNPKIDKLIDSYGVLLVNIPDPRSVLGRSKYVFKRGNL